jgi:hypothetical protein
MTIIPNDELSNADLIVDAIYEGASDGQLAKEPIVKVLPGCGNMGGFRFSGTKPDKHFVVLYSTGENKDWPDRLDLITGQFIYYGDNQTPGKELHKTHKGGNKILRRSFEHLHSSPPDRESIPPFFVFTKYPTETSSRSVQFKGLAVPGYPGLSATEDLIAVWKTTDGQRFQNYRSTFTVLDVPVIERAWIATLTDKPNRLSSGPSAWKDWVGKGVYLPLKSEPTTVIRSLEEQTPDTEQKSNILSVVHEYFTDQPISFEAFAARIFQMQDQRVSIDQITRGSVDGGRDAIGRYRIGLEDDPVYADFALEAKCYAPPLNGQRPNTVGVKKVARLISRIRHRQFGVLVTTSVVARQAYQEVREDGHPIIFISGKDIAETLIRNGHNTSQMVQAFLENEFPKTTKP